MYLLVSGLSSLVCSAECVVLIHHGIFQSAKVLALHQSEYVWNLFSFFAYILPVQVFVKSNVHCRSLTVQYNVITDLKVHSLMFRLLPLHLCLLFFQGHVTFCVYDLPQDWVFFDLHVLHSYNISTYSMEYLALILLKKFLYCYQSGQLWPCHSRQNILAEL